MQMFWIDYCSKEHSKSLEVRATFEDLYDAPLVGKDSEVASDGFVDFETPS